MTGPGEPAHQQPRHDRRTAVLDIAIVLGASAVYVAMELAGVGKAWSFAFMAVAMLPYVVWIARRGDSWRAHGFRTDTLAASARAVGLGTLCGIGALLLWAHRAGRPLWPEGTVVLLPLYLPYGVFQQWLFQGVLQQRLRQLLGCSAWPVLLTAAAFAAVHLGNAALVMLTAIAGLGWSAAFARWPNVWTVGVSHGVLAALAYPLALGEAPLSRPWH